MRAWSLLNAASYLVSSKVYRRWPFSTKSPSENPTSRRSADILDVILTVEMGTTRPVYLYSSISLDNMAVVYGTDISGAFGAAFGAA